jgi:hypothetical protein
MSATSPKELHAHLQQPMAYHDLFEDAHAEPKKKPRDTNFSLGLSTSGLNLELLKKNILRREDSIKLAFNLNQ